MANPLVVLDACTLKHAVDRRIVAYRRKKSIEWGGSTVTATIWRWAEVFPWARLDSNLLSHVILLPLIAHLARKKRIVLMAHPEMLGEFCGLSETNDPRGRFLGAPIQKAPDPLRYSRMILGAGLTAAEHRFLFLDGLSHPRFLELQRVTGANNPGPKRPNQLADAFHIWTAEKAEADFFLTTDLKLVKSAAVNRPEKPTVSVVAPQELVARLRRDRVLRLRDIASWGIYRWKTKGRGPANHPQEQLLDMSRATADDSQTFLRQWIKKR